MVTYYVTSRLRKGLQGVRMKLKQEPKCYTDVCVNGKWFHHDHGTTTAYMLKGGATACFELARMPVTENELVEMLSNAL